MAELFIGIVTGAIGLGYIVYGRKQQRFAPLVCGIALCAYPWFVHGVAGLCVIGAALSAEPWLVDF